MKLKAILTAIVTSVAAATATHAETHALSEQPIDIRLTPLLDLFQRAPNATVNVHIEERWTMHRPGDCWAGRAEVKNADIPRPLRFHVCEKHRRHEDLTTRSAYGAYFLQPAPLPDLPDRWSPDLPEAVHSLVDAMSWVPAYDYSTRSMKVNFTITSSRDAGAR